MSTDPMWCFENYGEAAQYIDELEQQRDELVKAMQIIATTPGSAAHHRIAHQALVRGDAPPFGAASPGMTG